MVRSRVRVLFVLLALIIAPMAGAAAQIAATAQNVSPVPPLAEAMPADVPLFVSTEFDPASEQYLNLGGLAAHVLVSRGGDVVAMVVEQLAQLLTRLPSDLRTVLEGEIGIGLTGFHELDSAAMTENRNAQPNGGLGSLLPGYVMVLHPREVGIARQLAQDWFTQQLEGAGLEPDVSQDGTVLILRNPDPANASTPNLPHMFVMSGDYILLGSNYADLMPYIETTQGNAPSLAESQDLQDLNDALPTERLLFGYIDGIRLLDSLTTLFDASTVAESLEAPFGQTAFTLATDDPGIRFESVSMPMDGESLSRVIPSEIPDFAARIPDSTLAMAAGQNLGESWAIKQVQSVLLNVLTGSMGGGEIGLTGVDVDTQFGILAMLLGVNLKTDLMDQLQGNYGAALFSLDTADPLGSSAVIASELADSDRVSVAVTTLGPLIQSAGPGTASVTTSSIDRETVVNVAVGDPVGRTVQYGVVDDMLMVGIGDGIATLAETPSAPLANSAMYQQALSELPSTYDGVLYVDLRDIAHAVAPFVIEAVAANSDNALADCVAENTSSATPVPAAGSGDTMLGMICSVLGDLFGPNAMQDFIVSRIPGPIAAVTYTDGDLRHVSGILLVGSND